MVIIVVQVGDQVDRCRPMQKGDCRKKDFTINDENSDLKIMELFYKLDKQARKEGGFVISLLGNHEINNVLGSTPTFYKGIVEYKNEININTGEKIADEQGFVGTDYEVGEQVRQYL